jgi:hypothetical protein
MSGSSSTIRMAGSFKSSVGSTRCPSNYSIQATGPKTGRVSIHVADRCADVAVFEGERWQARETARGRDRTPGSGLVRQRTHRRRYDGGTHVEVIPERSWRIRAWPKAIAPRTPLRVEARRVFSAGCSGRVVPGQKGCHAVSGYLLRSALFSNSSTFTISLPFLNASARLAASFLATIPPTI